MILKSLDESAADTVTPAKVGIRVLFLGPRFRGDDNQANLASANAKSVPRWRDTHRQIRDYFRQLLWFVQTLDGFLVRDNSISFDRLSGNGNLEDQPGSAKAVQDLI